MHLTDMTDDDLIRAQQERDTMRTRVRDEMIVIQRELDRRAALRTAQAAYGRLNTDEQAALYQLVRAGGLETESDIGQPGKG